MYSFGSGAVLGQREGGEALLAANTIQHTRGKKMPISIQLSPGLLTHEGQRTVFSRIAAVLLDVHGLHGNKFMTPNVIGHVTVFPEGASYVDGTPQSLAVIEVKVPSVTFVNPAVQQAFVERVTDVIDEL